MTTQQPRNQPQDRGIDVESIITAPLVAASKANVVMMTGQQRFLLDYCFTRREEDDGSISYDPILINMVMVQSFIDHSKEEDDPGFMRQVKLGFSVPLLCLVPFSSLAIEKLKIDFEIELTTATVRSTTTADGTIVGAKTQLSGRISSSSDDAGGSTKSRYRSRRSSTLKLSVDIGQLPLPTGVLTILDMYTKAILPTPAPEADTT